VRLFLANSCITRWHIIHALRNYNAANTTRVQRAILPQHVTTTRDRLNDLANKFDIIIIIIISEKQVTYPRQQLTGQFRQRTDRVVECSRTAERRDGTVQRSPIYKYIYIHILISQAARQGLAVLIASAVVVLKDETSTLRQRHNFISIDLTFDVSNYVREVTSHDKVGSGPMSGRDATWGQHLRVL